MNISDLKNYINSKDFNEIVLKYYCTKDKNDIDDERDRYLKLIDKAYELYGDGDYHIISYHHLVGLRLVVIIQIIKKALLSHLA